MSSMEDYRIIASFTMKKSTYEKLKKYKMIKKKQSWNDMFEYLNSLAERDIETIQVH